MNYDIESFLGECAFEIGFKLLHRLIVKRHSNKSNKMENSELFLLSHSDSNFCREKNLFLFKINITKSNISELTKNHFCKTIFFVTLKSPLCNV